MPVSGGISGNIDTVQLSHLLGTDIVTATSTSLVLSGGGVSLKLTGFGLTYDSNEQLVGGTVTNIEFADPEPVSAFGRVLGHIDGLSLPAATLVGWLAQNANTLAFSTIFSGNDVIGGTLGGADLLRGFDGNDTIASANGGPDAIYGGNGDDSMTASATSADLLDGGPGADTMAGGGGTFADIFQVGAGESSAALAAGGATGRIDHITDWTNADFLLFTGGVLATPSTYAEITADSFDQAATVAQTNLGQGIEYTVAQVGADLIVFDLKDADAVVLSNRTLADISLANVGGNPGLAGQPPPTGGGHAQLFDGYEADLFKSTDLNASTRIVQSSTSDEFDWGAGYHLIMTGSGFVYGGGANGFGLTAGTVTGMDIVGPYGHAVLTDLNVSGAALAQAFLVGDQTLSNALVAAGNDLIEVMGTTPPATDTVFESEAWGGNDTMLGGGSRSSLFGGDGDDVINARSGDGNYLRGDAGNDSILGAAGFDDINGNQGNDTVHGGAGDDWTVGGKDNDQLFGDAGNDIVWGNLGNDTLDGGDGADQVRGGQGDDVLDGGAGNDFVSGDRGNDTISGGLGADLFHGSQDAGIDRVTDFRVSDGDRVMLDPGTNFTLTQVGADTVLDMGSGNQMILVGVQMSSLPPGTIFFG